MGRPAKVTQAKRNREMQKRMKQQDKEDQKKLKIQFELLNIWGVMNYASIVEFHLRSFISN